MAIRSIGAKALQQNTTDSAGGAESNFVAKNSIDSAKAVANEVGSGNPMMSWRRVSRRLVIAGCLGLIAVGSTGCTMTTGLGRSLTNHECIDDFMIAYRNKAMAEKAWHCRKDRFCNQCFEKEFKDGFLAGYAAVAEGGYACTPAIAPSQYWGWRYQSASGQGAVNAWFQGFPEGARAAEEDGIGNWRQVGYSGPRSAPGLPGQPMHSLPAGAVVAPGLAPVHGGSVTPGTVTPANPFFQDGSAPATGVPIEIGSPSDLNGGSLDIFDSVHRDDANDSFRDVVSSKDVRFDVERTPAAGKPAARTASKGSASNGPSLSAPTVSVNDNTDFDVEKIFGSSAGSTTVEDNNALPFSFE